MFVFYTIEMHFFCFVTYFEIFFLLKLKILISNG